MGAFLDSAKDIRQDKKNPPRQAHKAEEKLAKDKDKGVKKMTMSLSDIKSGRPLSFIVAYSGHHLQYTVREFSAEIHDLSPIAEVPGRTNLPATGGLEKVTILINSVRKQMPDPKETSGDMDTKPILFDGLVPKEIRPELEDAVRQTAQSFGYAPREILFIYPQGE